MRFVKTDLIFFLLLILGQGLFSLTSISEIGENPPSTHAYVESTPTVTFTVNGLDSLKKYYLTPFQSLFSTTSSEGRVKIAKVAKAQFGDHPFVEEWIELYFQLGVNGQGTVANMKRLAELEIEMLTDIDAEKHATQIQQRRKILEYYIRIVTQLKSQGKNPEKMIMKLDLFQAVLLIEPAVARSELSVLAKVLFGTHPRAEEWANLYFQLSVDGKGSLVNLKYLTQLEMEMLTDIDAEKHATQIQKYQKTLERYETLFEVFKNQGKNPKEVVLECLPSTELREVPQQKPTHYEEDDHHRSFVSLISTNPEAAKDELSKYVKKLFGNHPLAEEWMQLYFQRARNGETTLVDNQRYLELEIEMLTDIDAEKHAKRIEDHRNTLKHHADLIKRFKSEGINPEGVIVKITFR